MGPQLTRCTFLLTVLSTLAAAAAPTIIAHLPNVVVKAAKVDSAGNIYVAGQSSPTTSSTAAYIAKLSPDGAAIYYAVNLGGKGSSAATVTALDIDSTGAAYVAGTTTAPDFPVTAGAVQTSGATAFAVKVDPKGNVAYAALIGGNAQTQPQSVAVNSRGELMISGQLTAGAPPSGSLSLFVFKLSADGTQVVQASKGIGGLVALDAQDNVYVAGVAALQSNDPPATAGAFQSAPAVTYCGCPFLSFPCGGDQFLASLTADLSQTRFLTYITSRYGATPAYITIDPAGNILIAGTTLAPNYPTTSGSYQPNYTAASGTELTCGPPIPLEYTSPSGYVTLVKPDGSGLVFSTFFSGSKTDTVRFAALTRKGIYLGGQAGSVDLPGLDGAVPSQCVPLGFVTRMTLDGSAVSASHTPPGTPVAYDAASETLLLVSGNALLRYDPSQDTPIACILDAADLSPVESVAPGELLAMFGRFSFIDYNPFGSAINPINGRFPVSAENFQITANQTPAPLLYLSEQQVNFQTPYEIAQSPQPSLTFGVTYSEANGRTNSDSRTFQMIGSNPVAFLSQLRPSVYNQTFPLTLNQDGTINSQSNPAPSGSVVTIFVEGLGLTNPAPTTGLLTTAPTTPLNLQVTVTTYCTTSTNCYPAPAFVSATPSPGSISGVTQVQLQAPANPHSGFLFQSIFSLFAGTAAVRDSNLSFWVK